MIIIHPFSRRRIYYIYYTRYQFGGGSSDLRIFFDPSVGEKGTVHLYSTHMHSRERMLKVKGEKESFGKRMKKKKSNGLLAVYFQGNKDPVSAREKGNFLIRLNRRL